VDRTERELAAALGFEGDVDRRADQRLGVV
jgi:hypothetical protein